MVCDECQSKVDKLATPEVKFDSKDTVQPDRVIKGKGNLLFKKYTQGTQALVKCHGCESRAEKNNKYCLTCAYMKGICEMCGKKIADTQMYKFTDVNYKDNKRKVKMMERSREISKSILKKKSVKEQVCNKHKRIELSKNKMESIVKEEKVQPEHNLEVDENEYEEVVKF